jgi:electron transfer flavoprotein alpha/beta subunit
MTRFADALGTKYQQNREKIFTRKFELGGHTFKVRIPYVHESDAIYKRINEPDEAKVAQAYKQMTEPLMVLKDQDAGFTFTEDDVLIEGRSLKEAAKQKIQVEIKITEFVKLLVPELEGASLDDLTYEEIEAEFPMAVQMQLVEKIAEAISPTYKESKGN